MPLFYFHLRDGVDIVLDEEGRQLPDLDAAAAAALVDARAIIGHDALGGRIDLGQCLDVEDAERKVVHRLRFVDAVEIVPPAA